MTKKIFRSIFMVALCVMLACLTFVMGILYSSYEDSRHTQMKNTLIRSSEGVENAGENYFKDLNLDCRLTWIDSDGTVLFDSEFDPAEMENHSERQEFSEALKKGDGESVRYSSTGTERTVYLARRLSDGTVLRVSESHVSFFRLVLSMLLPIILVTAAALLLSWILARGLTDKILRPLTDLDLDRPLENNTYEELSPLLEKLDRQRREIEEKKKELADRRLNMEFAEENRREFTANVSHELKTPLQSIMGSAELLENGLAQGEDVPKFAGNIRRESNRLLSLIDDIIHLSRLDENSEMEFCDVDIYDICKSEVEAIRPLSEKLGVQVRLVGEHITISAVPQLVREIVHNLVDNAIKYNTIGGKVTVRVNDSVTKNILSVSDTGIGIPEEHRDRIFERFYRVDKSHSKASGGTGLGLSIVKHAAAYMNAEISFDTEVGVGTTVIIRFPK